MFFTSAQATAQSRKRFALDPWQQQNIPTVLRIQSTADYISMTDLFEDCSLRFDMRRSQRYFRSELINPVAAFCDPMPVPARDLLQTESLDQVGWKIRQRFPGRFLNHGL